MGWSAFPAPSLSRLGGENGAGLGDGVNWESADLLAAVGRAECFAVEAV